MPHYAPFKPIACTAPLLAHLIAVPWAVCLEHPDTPSPLTRPSSMLISRCLKSPSHRTPTPHAPHNPIQKSPHHALRRFKPPSIPGPLGHLLTHALRFNLGVGLYEEPLQCMVLATLSPGHAHAPQSIYNPRRPSHSTAHIRACSSIYAQSTCLRALEGRAPEHSEGAEGVQ